MGAIPSIVLASPRVSLSCHGPVRELRLAERAGARRVAAAPAAARWQRRGCARSSFRRSSRKDADQAFNLTTTAVRAAQLPCIARAFDQLLKGPITLVAVEFVNRHGADLTNAEDFDTFRCSQYRPPAAGQQFRQSKVVMPDFPLLDTSGVTARIGRTPPDEGISCPHRDLSN